MPLVVADRRTLKIRDTLQRLQEAMENHPNRLAVTDFPVKHHFTDGLYTREALLPAGTTVVGKIHRHNHMLMLLKGKAYLASTEGLEFIQAPFVGESKAGIRRAVHALTDCIFVTTHVTSETDLTKIEEYVIAPNYKSLEDNT